MNADWTFDNTDKIFGECTPIFFKLDEFVSQLMNINDTGIAKLMPAFFESLPELDMIDQPVVYVEGNIGSGKSTFLNFFEQLNSSDIKLIEEPLFIWQRIKDGNGKDSLTAFYDALRPQTLNPTFALIFELLALFTRVFMLHVAITKKPKLYLSERSIFTDRYHNLSISVIETLYRLHLFLFYKKGIYAKFDWHNWCRSVQDIFRML